MILGFFKPDMATYPVFLLLKTAVHLISIFNYEGIHFKPSSPTS